MSTHPVLAATGVAKRFAGTVALAGLDFSIEQGEVRALLGENGSGKSTFIKILSGYYDPDPGAVVRINGTAMHLGSPDSSYSLGARFVHQDLGLVDTSSVLDNLYLNGGFPSFLGTIRRREALREARADLARVGLENVDPRALVGSLTPAAKTGVAVARALRTDSGTPVRLLVVDEPTATLPDNEVQHFLEIIRLVAGTGVGVLYVTHRLDEVFDVADRVSVLRDGHLVATEETDKLDRRQLIDLLLGTELDELHAVAETLDPDTGAAPVLEVESLDAGALQDITLAVRPGEIVGIAGITGSGRESLLGVIFGARPREAGSVRVEGAELPSGRPDRAMASRMGYVPPDRKLLAGIMDFSARENISLSDLSPFWRRLRIRRKAERAEAKGWFERLDVRPSGQVENKLLTFSGGNQQKVVMAKWLRREPAVLLLDEPTQGVDVGAKAQLHRLLVEAAAGGAGILVSSSDVDELAALCQRVIVLRDGRVANLLRGTSVTVPNIARECLGAHRRVIAS